MPEITAERIEALRAGLERVKTGRHAPLAAIVIECLDEIERLQRPRLCASCRFYHQREGHPYMLCGNDNSSRIEPEPDDGCPHHEVANA